MKYAALMMLMVSYVLAGYDLIESMENENDRNDLILLMLKQIKQDVAELNAKTDFLQATADYLRTTNEYLEATTHHLKATVAGLSLEVRNIEQDCSNALRSNITALVLRDEEIRQLVTDLSTKEQAHYNELHADITFLKQSVNKDNKDFIMNRVFEALTFSESAVANQIFNFYNYRYDSVNQINDGGFDMYDAGNQIFFGSSNVVRTGAAYQQRNDTYYGNDDFSFGVHTGYPFTALMFISNETGNDDEFQIEVVSNYGSDGQGNYTTYSGENLLPGSDGCDYTTKYEAFHVYGASGDPSTCGINECDPSICEVYFTVSSQCATDAWSSGSDFDFSVLQQSRPTSAGHAVATVTGSPADIVFGYFLLSREYGGLISEDEVSNALYEMVNTIAGPGYEQDYPFPHLPVPTS